MADDSSTQPVGVWLWPSLRAAPAYGLEMCTRGLVDDHADERAFSVEHADAGRVEGDTPVRIGRTIHRVDHRQERR
jgi:hypothetical protein